MQNIFGDDVYGAFDDTVQVLRLVVTILILSFQEQLKVVVQQ